jgi:hypothetical protein
MAILMLASGADLRFREAAFEVCRLPLPGELLPQTRIVSHNPRFAVYRSIQFPFELFRGAGRKEWSRYGSCQAKSLLGFPGEGQDRPRAGQKFEQLMVEGFGVVKIGIYRCTSAKNRKLLQRKIVLYGNAAIIR